MVKKYQDALAEAAQQTNFDIRSTKPEPDVVWYAYKQGVYLGFSEVSHSHAVEEFDTKVIEKIVVNQEEIDAWTAQWEQTQSLAFKLWYQSLLDDYHDLPMDVLELCYQRAYGQGHSCGYDEVAMYMDEYVEFAENVIRAANDR